MDNNKKIFIVVVILLIIGVFATVLIRGNSNTGDTSGKYDAFAQCLTDQGATFYGAFWCPHCQAQKKDFGSSQKLLNYVECSTLDGNGQTQICIDKNITGYPTWEFADGSRLNGRISFEQLSEVTGCALPGDEDVNAQIETSTETETQVETTTETELQE